MSTCAETPWRVAAARTTERMALAVRPPRPITLPMSSGATRTVIRHAALVLRLGDRHGVGVVDQFARQELHELPHASVVSSSGAASTTSSTGGSLSRGASSVTGGLLSRRCCLGDGCGVVDGGSCFHGSRLFDGSRRRLGLGGALAAAFFDRLARLPGFSVRVRTGRRRRGALPRTGPRCRSSPSGCAPGCWAARRRGASAARAPRRSRSSDGSSSGWYLPMFSMKRPSRGARWSATTTR